MQVPLLDLSREYKPLGSEIQKAINSIINSHSFILGPTLKEFETNFANFTGATHAFGVSSGTDALIVALMALNINQNHEVITTPYSFFATPEAIIRVGAKPIFSDIDLKTFCIDPSQIESKITPKTRAILIVHLFGKPCNLNPIVELAKEYKLWLIEDCAQAIGTKYQGKHVGTFGDVSAFSFYPTKNLGGIGDGGAVLTNSSKIATTIQKLRIHGASSKYLHQIIGGNFRLDDINAAVLNIKLKHLPEYLKMRQEIARTYHSLFKQTKLVEKELIIIPELDAEHSFNQYTIRAVNRDQLKDFLQSNGVGSAVYYPVPLHLQPALKYLGYKEGDFPNAEKLSKEALSLPIFPYMTKEEIEYVVGTIEKFYKTTG